MFSLNGNMLIIFVSKKVWLIKKDLKALSEDKIAKMVK